jgi:hypothetical protein
MRRALDELADLDDGAELRAAVVILDVEVPDPDHADAPLTHVLWKSAPLRVSTAHVHGLASLTATAVLRTGDADD